MCDGSVRVESLLGSLKEIFKGSSGSSADLTLNEQIKIFSKISPR